jgi:hypothetical protein
MTHLNRKRSDHIFELSGEQLEELLKIALKQDRPFEEIVLGAIDQYIALEKRHMPEVEILIEWARARQVFVQFGIGARLWTDWPGRKNQVQDAQRALRQERDSRIQRFVNQGSFSCQRSMSSCDESAAALWQERFPVRLGRRTRLKVDVLLDQPADVLGAVFSLGGGSSVHRSFEF